MIQPDNNQPKIPNQPNIPEKNQPLHDKGKEELTKDSPSEIAKSILPQTVKEPEASKLSTFFSGIISCKTFLSEQINHIFNSSIGVQPDKQPEEGPIKNLPPELMGLILSNTDNIATVSTVRVNKALEHVTINTAKNTFASDIMSCKKTLCEQIDLLSEKLDKADNQYKEKASKLKDVKLQISELTPKEIFNSANLVEIKSSGSKLINDIALVLGKLTDEDLATVKKSLKSKEMPVSLEEILYLAGNIAAISKNFAGFGKFDEAIELANTIINDKKKSECLWSLSLLIARKGDYDKAEEVAYAIDDEIVRHRTFEHLHEIYVSQGEVDRAKKMWEATGNQN
jgi:hypothetical protein